MLVAGAECPPSKEFYALSFITWIDTLLCLLLPPLPLTLCQTDDISRVAERNYNIKEFDSVRPAVVSVARRDPEMRTVTRLQNKIEDSDLVMRVEAEGARRKI